MAGQCEVLAKGEQESELASLPTIKFWASSLCAELPTQATRSGCYNFYILHCYYPEVHAPMMFSNACRFSTCTA